LLNRIEAYRRKIPGRIPSRNEAIQKLLHVGLDSWEENNQRDPIRMTAREGNHETGTDA